MVSLADGKNGVRSGPKRPERRETWPRALALLALVAACGHETIELFPEQGEEQSSETAGQPGSGPAGAGGAQSSSAAGGTENGSDAGGTQSSSAAGGSGGGGMEPDAYATGGSAAEGPGPGWGGSVQYDANGIGGFPTGGQGQLYAWFDEPCGIASYPDECEAGLFCDQYVHRCVPLCDDDRDCQESPGSSVLPPRPVCAIDAPIDAPQIGHCVECAEDRHCPEVPDPGEEGQFLNVCIADRGLCVQCGNDDACKGPTPWCNSDSQRCVQCLENTDCFPGEICDENLFVCMP
jgi:hypothetical protein